MSIGKSVVCEIYPSLCAKQYLQKNRNPHQQDAWAAATWLHECDASGALQQYFQTEMPVPMKAEARVEGWILGVDPPRFP